MKSDIGKTLGLFWLVTFCCSWWGSHRGTGQGAAWAGSGCPAGCLLTLPFYSIWVPRLWNAAMFISSRAEVFPPCKSSWAAHSDTANLSWCFPSRKHLLKFHTGLKHGMVTIASGRDTARIDIPWGYLVGEMTGSGKIGTKRYSSHFICSNIPKMRKGDWEK